MERTYDRCSETVDETRPTTSDGLVLYGMVMVAVMRRELGLCTVRS